MPNIKQGWWTKLSPADLAEMEAMMRDPSISYKDIAALYGRSSSEVSLYAKKIGLPPRSVHGAHPTNGQPSSLKAVEAELAALVAQQEELKRKADVLKARRAELQVRFEYEGGEVAVYGIGEGPFRAPAEAWINFFNVEGGRRLREFIVAEGRKR